MSRGHIWAVSTRGNVYYLQVGENQWNFVNNEGQHLRGFKKVSGTKEGAWGLGCDQQIYVFIRSTELPVRSQQVTYENERWILGRGWSNTHLLPIDPFPWSNESGEVMVEKDSIKLPSDNWVWDSDWYVDENVRGYLTDKGGWRYSSISFDRDFSHKKSMNSCVRRRRWIRSRDYTALDHWARIAGIHVDPTEEPITDLAAGGEHLPHQPAGFTAVWAVTIDGKVLFRTGVSQVSPEGQSWSEVGTEEGQELLTVSVGPTGQVWGITWSGEVLVRAGVSWQNIKGTSWVSVEAPDVEDRLIHVAVGVRTVWACSGMGKVWLRKGLDLEAPGTEDTEGLTGTGWLQMVHSMKLLALGPNDQIWGIGNEDSQIHFRTGVCPEEPSGRVWKCINLPLHVPDTNSFVDKISIASKSSQQESEDDDSCFVDCPDEHGSFPVTLELDCDQREVGVERDTDMSHLTSEYTETLVGDTDGASISSDSNKTGITCSSKQGATTIKNKNSSRHALQSWFKDKVDKNIKLPLTETIQKNITDKIQKNITDKIQKSFHSTTMQLSPEASVSFSKSDINLKVEIQSQSSPDSFSSSRNSSQCDLPNGSNGGNSISSTSQLSSAAMQNTNDSATMTGLSENFENALSAFFDPRLMTMETCRDTEEDVMWGWVSAADCNIQDETAVSDWFSSRTVTGEQLYQLKMCGEWREQILDELRQRNEHWSPELHSVPLAIDKTGWSKKGSLRWWRDTEWRGKWVDSQIELTQDSSTEGSNGPATGMFAVQYKKKGLHKTLWVELNDVVCVRALSDSDVPSVMGVQLASRLSSVPRLPPLRLAGSGENDIEDWMAALSIACCEQYGVRGIPWPQSLWALSGRGDIFIHQPCRDEEDITNMFWHQYGGHLCRVETCGVGVTWGLGDDGTLWVYTGGYGGSFFKGMGSSPYGLHPQSDTVDHYVYENQRWRLIRGYTDRFLQTKCYAWSDETGQVEVTKDGSKLPSRHWQWTSNWNIDRRLKSGVDKDGWQYGPEINKPFYSQPKINSIVRRRRWMRKARIVTSGPWEEVQSVNVCDVSLALQNKVEGSSTEGVVTVWAVGSNGNVLCRPGVTKTRPRGTTWNHVAADQAMVGVSVGSRGHVWVVAADGGAWLRVGVSKTVPEGDCWLQVPPPKKSILLQISAGAPDIWAVDQEKNLWYRTGICSPVPEGTGWVLMHRNVQHVSCGSEGQVWGILNKVNLKGGVLDGVISRLTKFDPTKTKSATWEHGLGGGWSYISCRGWDMPV